MSKSFVRHDSTKVPICGRGLCLLCYVVSDTFLGKITMLKYVRKIWKKLVRAEILTNADRCGNLQRADFVNTFFSTKKMEIVSNFHFLTRTSNFRKSLQLLSFFQIFPYLPNFHIPNIPIFHVSKFLQFWNKRPLLIFLKSPFDFHIYYIPFIAISF